MNLHDTNANTRLDYLYRRTMIFLCSVYAHLTCFQHFFKNYPNLPDSMVIWTNPSRALESRPLLDTFKWLKITGIHWYSKNKAFPSSVFKSVRRESNAWARWSTERYQNTSNKTSIIIVPLSNMWIAIVRVTVADKWLKRLNFTFI